MSGLTLFKISLPLRSFLYIFQLEKISKEPNKKYAGFTMLECLVALVVLSCMCQLFQLMIQQSFIGNQYLKNNDSKSWHIFLIQLEKECQKLVFQTGSAQEISFLDSETNKTISIQIKEDKIISRSNLP